MKKLKYIICLALVSIVLCGCGSDNGLVDQIAQGVTSVPTKQASSMITNTANLNTPTPTAEVVLDYTEESPAPTEEPLVNQGGSELDLTTLSSIMIYAEVYNMMVNPDDYIGKKIIIHGEFAVYESGSEVDYGRDYYYAVVIQDATACCQQGVEFVLADTSLQFPDDYPEIGTEITVSGEFQTYMEGDTTYANLINAAILEE